MMISSRAFRCCLRTDALRPFSVFEVSIFIGEDKVPTKLSKMTPTIEDHPAIKRLAFRRDHHTIVLSPGAGVRFTPVKFKSLEFQRIERGEQVLRPLITVPAFPKAVIDEKIIKDRRAKHAVLLSEPINSGVGAGRQEGRLLSIHSG